MQRQSINPMGPMAPATNYQLSLCEAAALEAEGAVAERGGLGGMGHHHERERLAAEADAPVAVGTDVKVVSQNNLTMKVEVL